MHPSLPHQPTHELLQLLDQDFAPLPRRHELQHPGPDLMRGCVDEFDACLRVRETVRDVLEFRQRGVRQEEEEGALLARCEGVRDGVLWCCPVVAEVRGRAFVGGDAAPEVPEVGGAGGADGGGGGASALRGVVGEDFAVGGRGAEVAAVGAEVVGEGGVQVGRDDAEGVLAAWAGCAGGQGWDVGGEWCGRVEVAADAEDCWSLRECWRWYVLAIKRG